MGWAGGVFKFNSFPICLRILRNHLRRITCDDLFVHSTTWQPVVRIWFVLLPLVPVSFCSSFISSFADGASLFCCCCIRLLWWKSATELDDPMIRFLYDGQLARRSTCRKHASHKQLSTVSFSSSKSKKNKNQNILELGFKIRMVRKYYCQVFSVASPGIWLKLRGMECQRVQIYRHNRSIGLGIACQDEFWMKMLFQEWQALFLLLWLPVQQVLQLQLWHLIIIRTNKS